MQIDWWHTGTPGLSRIAKCVRWSHWHLTVEPSWLIRPHPLVFHSPLGNLISDLIEDIILLINVTWFAIRNNFRPNIRDMIYEKQYRNAVYMKSYAYKAAVCYKTVFDMF